MRPVAVAFHHCIGDQLLYDEKINDYLSRRSLVRHFVIEGLYGYRTVSLSSEFAATIVIAKNGAGKTTLIGTMNAFLTGQLGRLRELQFRQIRCQIYGIEDDLVVNASDIEAFCAVAEEDFVKSLAARAKITALDILNFICRYRVGERYPAHPVWNAIYRLADYNTPEAEQMFARILTIVRSTVPRIAILIDALNKALADVEIVYLPTYRRIELPLTDTDSPRGRRKFADLDESGLHPGDIQFGLSDIAAHLRGINDDILFQSNQGYRTISANIINELMAGQLDQWDEKQANVPIKADLDLFLTRLRDGQEARHFGPYYNISIPDLRGIDDRASTQPASNKFLKYFLTKLNDVIKLTHVQERRVEEFVTMCNKYLSLRDMSVTAPNESPGPQNIDSKELRLNKRNLNVDVFSIPADKEISLEALSSGEKQMISLFAKLYLYSKEKLILIDEPELSLSLEWQRHILVDVLKAPLCRQVVAITHSPFIFDNDLEAYARSLRVKLDPPSSTLIESSVSSSAKLLRD